ncbi:UNVERIFIED_CONTAM: hypothetical protein K2H54_066746 [Gekko kuhli]
MSGDEEPQLPVTTEKRVLTTTTLPVTTTPVAMLQEALMDIPRLVAQVIQEEMVASSCSGPTGTGATTSTPPGLPDDQALQLPPPVPPMLGQEHRPTELLDATFDGTPEKLAFFVVQVEKFIMYWGHLFLTEECRVDYIAYTSYEMMQTTGISAYTTLKALSCTK